MMNSTGDQFRGTPLNIALKGNRNYIHGTDIFDALVSLSTHFAGAQRLPTDLDISFHKLAYSGLTLFHRRPAGAECSVHFSFQSGNERKEVYLIEDNRPIIMRRPFDEEKIIAPAIFSEPRTASEPSVEVDVNDEFSPIESWIAITKALHLKQFPYAHGKWLFTRGRFARYDAFPKASKYYAALESSVGGLFTRTAISVDGERIGDIFFTLWNGTKQ